MSKRYLNKIVAVLFIVILILTQTNISNATNKSDAQNELNEAESNKAQAESEAENLENQKTGLQSYLSDLNSQLEDINTSISELQLKISNKEQEIEENNQRLEVTKALEAKQYESMKMRIQFMYEFQGVDYIDILFSSGNLADLINRAEYVDMLVEYDRNMLEQYTGTMQSIEETQKKLTQEQEELLALREEVQKKQNEFTALMNNTKTEISQHQSEIEEAMEKALAYEEEIRAKQETIAQLEAEEARRQQEAAKEKTPIDNNYVEQAGDLELLAAIIYCEARGESYEGMLAVGSVVLNRVNSSKFPASIREVIYQSGQFTPVASGRFELALAQGANETCTNAAKEVLGGTITGSWLYFRTDPNNIIQGTRIGNHVFY